MTHYKTNSRTDTEYWRANAANLNISDPLKRLYNCWMSGNSIVPEVKQSIGKAYPVFSWYCIMSGMGIFPDPKDLQAPNARENRYSMAEIDNLLTQRANFRDQRGLLEGDFARRADESLQIYSGDACSIRATLKFRDQHS